MTPRQPSPFYATACALYVIACGWGSPAVLQAAEEAIRRIPITIQNRQVLGDDRVIRVTEGDRVELEWSTDEAVQLHLHGYDVRIEVTPNAPAVMSLTAHATGRFPVTSHGFGSDRGHDTLLYLEVYPD